MCWNAWPRDSPIRISPKLDFVIKEFQGYVWDDKANEDRPIKVNDHAMDSLRYFVKTMRIANPRNQYINKSIW